MLCYDRIMLCYVIHFSSHTPWRILRTPRAALSRPLIKTLTAETTRLTVVILTNSSVFTDVLASSARIRVYETNTSHSAIAQSNEWQVAYIYIDMFTSVILYNTLSNRTYALYSMLLSSQEYSYSRNLHLMPSLWNKSLRYDRTRYSLHTRLALN